MKSIGCILGLLCSILAAPAEVFRDVEFARLDGVSLKLDVNVPDGNGPFPIAILVHGGGFTNVTQRDFISPLFAPLADARFTWFSIDYRGLAEAPFPAWVEDVETAIRWVKAHAADYKGDPTRIVLIGESFGAYLSGLAVGRATNDTKVHALISIYGPFADMSNVGDPPAHMRKTYGITNVQDAPRILREASLPTYVKRGWPPTLLIHGDTDPKVPYKFSVEAHKRLTALEVSCELITIKGGGHGMGEWDMSDPSYKTNLVRWVEQTLGRAGK